MKILLAVDGSPTVVLVTVHLPVPMLPNMSMSMVVGRPELERYYEEEGRASLGRAATRLREAGIASAGACSAPPPASCCTSPKPPSCS